MKKLRILILAQQNNPDWISVPLVGYEQSAALSRLHDVTLVTHFANREAILKRGDRWKDVKAIDLGIWEKFYDWSFKHIFREDFGSQILTAFRIPFYYAFEWKAWRFYKKALKSSAFDLVVRLTPVAPVVPSLMARKCRSINVPFVIGPINGGLPWPVGYSQAERQKEWVSHIRFFYRYLPFARSTYDAASAIVAGSSETFHEYLKYADKTFFMPENGIKASRKTLDAAIDTRPLREPHSRLKLLFVGRLSPFKACDLAIQAAAELLRAGRAEFVVVGDGGERKALEALAKSLNVRVTFTGMIPHPETMKHFLTADVLVFPSIREFGGGVVFEALVRGCVPIVSNYGGPGDIITDGVNGFKVDLKDEVSTVDGFKAVLERLSNDPALLERVAREGQRYAEEELSWDGKALKMTHIFEWLLAGKKSPKPQYLPPRTF